MISYTTVGTNNMEAAKKFYGALLAELGASEMMNMDDKFVMYGDGKGPMFAIAQPYDGKPATVGNGVMIALAARNPAQVKSLYDKAISLGAKDEGPAGPRMDGRFSCGYVRDPDGNKLNFFCMGS
ncbi:MAG TPA: VOC family protein [Parvularculaceae bacterium]|nr:VOC family protein [Parvularculaceae bacterium]